MLLRLLFYLLAAPSFLVVDAVPTNRTIDDTFGDFATGAKPIFLPQGYWDGPSCDPLHCHVLPPVDEAFDHTYSAATYLVGQGARTAQFSFTGTDIYVFFILANNIPNAGTQTLCKFILDGQPSDDYSHKPSSSPEYEYNALVYSRHNLRNTDHTLVISADGYNQLSFINFDYAIYTYDDGTVPPPTQAPSRPTSRSAPQPASSSSITQSTSHDAANIQPHTVIATISGSTVTQVIASQSEDPTSRFSLGPDSTSTPSGAPTSSNSTIVTSNNDKTSTTHKTPLGAIAGGVVGGVVFALALIILFVWRLRRSRKALVTPVTTPSQERPSLVPFTSLAPNNHTSETRAVEDGMLPVVSEKTRYRQQQADRSSRYPIVNTSSQSGESEIHLMQNANEASDPGTRSTTHRTRSNSSRSTSQPGDSRVSLLVQENQVMRAQIEQLQSQLGPDRSLRHPSEPPPGYFRSSTP